MLHFLKSNIYLTNELSNDITDEVWTTDFPACVNDADAEGIYEGVKLNKFNYLEDLATNPKFILDKKNVMLNRQELNGFVLSWYDSCVKRKAISNCVDRVQWLNDYISCYTFMYKQIKHTYEGALTYYEALASADLMSIDMATLRDTTSYGIRNMDKLNPQPEVSWMLEDYFKNNKKSVWANYLTEYIRGNIRGIRYKRAIASRARGAMFPELTIQLDVDMTIDDVDFSNKQAVYYFDNPFELDFHTNYIYIARMCGEVDK